MLKKICEKTKYELCIFLFLFLQLIIFSPTKDGMLMWPFLTYLGDYSRGFMPRVFLGEVITWFADTISLDLLFYLSVTVCLLVCILSAFVSGYLIRHSENKTAVTLIIAIMLGSPIFMPLMASWLGITNIHLILLTIIAFIFNENKFLRFLIPVLMLINTAILHAYLFLYMVPLAIALLYDCFKNKKYLRDGILCGVTYASLIAFGIICAFSRNVDGFSSSNEIVDYMISKADFPLDSQWVSELVPYEYFTGFDYLFKNLTSTMSASNLLGIILIFAPMFILSAYGWVKSIIKATDKKEKFIFFLCLIQPLSTVPAYIFGLNWNRWTSALITSQCILYLFMLHRKNETVSSVVSRITEFFKRNLFIAIFYIIYVASFATLLG